MRQYIFRRLLQAIPTLFGITILSYAIVVAAPGNPVATLAFGPRTTQAQKVQLAEQLGINDPVYKQYIRWLVGNDWQSFRTLDRRGNPVRDADGNIEYENGTQRGILRGDFGTSFVSKKPAMDVLVGKIPATLELGGLALLFGLGLGLPIGVLAAVWRGGWFDNITRVMAVVFNAVPVFWLGLLLLLIFGSQLGWLPMGGRYPTNYFITGEVTVRERVEHLILPVAVLSTGYVAVFSRLMRASTLDVLSQDYIRTAQAKGLRGRQVYFVHAARNAMIPIATILGPAIPGLIGGALITETIFSWPGVARTAFTAVLTQDYPVIMASVILVSLATIIGYLLSDILYALIDPRIRLS
ncbi:MAG: ABC transporter permease [Anaerolineae bacterium]|nr:ABC transporter permease [Anaerolineae bacterium]